MHCILTVVRENHGKQYILGVWNGEATGLIGNKLEVDQQQQV